MSHLLTPQLVEALVVLASTVLLTLISRLAHLLSQHTKAKYASELIFRVEHVVAVTVRSVEQTLVGKLRSHEGKLDKEDAEYAFQVATASARAALGPALLRELETLKVDVGSLIKQQIEAAVFSQKLERPMQLTSFFEPPAEVVARGPVQ